MEQHTANDKKSREFLHDSGCLPHGKHKEAKTKSRLDMDAWALANVLKQAGVCRIAHYVEMRWQTIAKFIINWPIFDHCGGGAGEQRRSIVAANY